MDNTDSVRVRKLNRPASITSLQSRARDSLLDDDAMTSEKIALAMHERSTSTLLDQTRFRGANTRM